MLGTLAPTDKKKAWAFLLWKRPMVPVVLAFVVGLSVGYKVSVPLPWVWIGAPLFLLCSVCFKKRKVVAHISLGLLFAVLGSGVIQLAIPAWYSDFSGQGSYVVEGVVAERITSTSNGTPIAILRDVTVQTGDEKKRIGGRVRVLLVNYETSEESIGEETVFFGQYGDVLRGEATLMQPRTAQYPSGYNERLTRLLEGIQYNATMEIHQAEVTLRESRMLSTARAIHRLRENIRVAFQENVGGEGGALLTALTTGDRSDMDGDTRVAFARLGIAHLLAVSGLHVALLLTVAAFLARKMKFGPLPELVLQLCVVCFYLLLTGPRPAILRVTIMWGILSLGRLGGRRPDGLNSMAAAMLAMLLLRPLDLFNVGFQLSFLSAGALMLFGGWNKLIRRIRCPAWLKEPVFSTLLVYLGTWPVVVWYFNQMPWVAPFANIVFIPLTTVLLAIGMGFVLVHLCRVYPVQVVLSWVLGWVSFLYLSCAYALDSFLRPINIPFMPLWFVLGWTASVLALSPRVARVPGKARAIFAGVLVGVCVFACTGPWASVSKAPSLYFFGDGRDEALVIHHGSALDAVVTLDGIYGFDSYVVKQGFQSIPRVIYGGDSIQGLDRFFDDLGDSAAVGEVLVPDNGAVFQEDMDWLSAKRNFTWRVLSPNETLDIVEGVSAGFVYAENKSGTFLLGVELTHEDSRALCASAKNLVQAEGYGVLLALSRLRDAQVRELSEEGVVLGDYEGPLLRDNLWNIGQVGGVSGDFTESGFSLRAMDGRTK